MTRKRFSAAGEVIILDRRHDDRAMNPLKPELMTPEERLRELAALLACGLIRLQARQSSSLSADRGESSVDFPPD